MFSRQIEVLKGQMETLQNQASALYTVEGGKIKANPGVTNEQILETTRKLKQIRDIYNKSLAQVGNLDQEIDEARVHVSQTRNKMLDLEREFSERLGRPVKLWNRFLRRCYDMDL